MIQDQALVDRLVDVFKALADPSRLRILGALAERPRTGKELGDLLDVGPPTISHHMAKLGRAGLIVTTRSGQRRIYRLNDATLRDLALPETGSTLERGLQPESEMDAEGRERAKVIRDFFDGRRLKQIPAQRKKRVIVLQHLLSRFEPNREYAEREVNTILGAAHEDYATLRRELIDYGFMTRAGGVYRVARDLPVRGAHVAQEIVGDEHQWLRRLLDGSVTD